MPTESNARQNLSIAVSQAAYKHKADMPPTKLFAGTPAYRSVDRFKEYSTPRGARTIPQTSSKQVTNRWQGSVSDSIRQGGLDAALDFIGAVAEAHHYSRLHEYSPHYHHRRDKKRKECEVGGARYEIQGDPEPFHKLTNAKSLFKFHLGHTVDVLDFRSSSEKFLNFLQKIEDDTSVRNAVKDLGRLVPGVSPETFDLMARVRYDHDMSRAVGVAGLSNSDSEGLVADGYRAHSLSWGNMVFKGSDGQELYLLVPDSEIIVGITDKGQPCELQRELSASEISEPLKRIDAGILKVDRFPEPGTSPTSN